MSLILFYTPNNLTAETKSIISFGTNDLLKKYRHGKIILTNKKELEITLLFSDEEMSKGVSGIQSKDFPDNAGVLFFYPSSNLRSFWMPNTYFNLDIIFLDDNFKIIFIARNMPAHPGIKNIHEVAKTKSIFARHVLEIKSESPLSKLLNEGMILNLKTPYSLGEIESNIHHLK